MATSTRTVIRKTSFAVPLKVRLRPFTFQLYQQGRRSMMHESFTCCTLSTSGLDGKRIRYLPMEMRHTDINRNPQNEACQTGNPNMT
jgi:hypothetical protein